MQSLLSHPALVSIPAAVAVIVATAMFISAMNRMGTSRDSEREIHLSTIMRMSEEFSESIRQLNESRLAEHKEMMEAYRQQSLCMQEMVSTCRSAREKGPLL
ncbi:MAG: hypothetical protein M1133_16335 [Armatimonadetes bacterium]|nr:hypothetical protein [Armatimonadota bacterium]